METSFFIAGLILYLVFLGVILWRIMSIKSGRFEYRPTQSLSHLLTTKVDALAYYVVVFSREAIKYSYVLIVLLTEKIIKLFKKVIIKIEHRFSGVVNQVRGKGDISKRGGTSLFWQEVKDHQDQIKSEIQGKYNLE